MCGRYILKQAELAEHYFAVHGTPWSPSFNVAPTHQVPVVRIKDGKRVGETLRWGLIPYFAKGEPPKGSTINARSETVATTASYKGPWQRGQRCIQVASGFYEWHLEPDGRKFPYYVHLSDHEVFGFASLWDRSRKDDGAVVESCALLTMPANELMHRIHNTGNNPHRMPVILRPEDHEAWLWGSANDAQAAIKQYPSDLMVAYRVGLRVNSPKNDDPALIEPSDGAENSPEQPRKQATSALLVVPNSGEIVEVLERKRIAPILKEAGACVAPKASDSERAQRAKLKKESAFRWKLFEAVHAKSPVSLSRTDLEQVAITTFSHHGYESRKRILKVWGWDRANGKPIDSIHHDQATRARVPKLSDAELARFLIDCVLVSELHVSAWVKNDQPERMLAAAKKLRIDVDAIRKDVESGGNPQGKLLPPAKAAKKSLPKAIRKSSRSLHA